MFKRSDESFKKAISNKIYREEALVKYSKARQKIMIIAFFTSLIMLAGIFMDEPRITVLGAFLTTINFLISYQADAMCKLLILLDRDSHIGTEQCIPSIEAQQNETQ